MILYMCEHQEQWLWLTEVRQFNRGKLLDTQGNYEKRIDVFDI